MLGRAATRQNFSGALAVDFAPFFLAIATGTTVAIANSRIDTAVENSGIHFPVVPVHLIMVPLSPTAQPSVELTMDTEKYCWLGG
jgi:hypothetical protein